MYGNDDLSLLSDALELPWLWAGLAAYAAAMLASILTVMPRPVGNVTGITKASTYAPRLEKMVLVFLLLGVALLSIAIAQRWVRLGHGPFVSMFELMMSQLWSLGLFFAVVYWRSPKLRSIAVVVLVLMWVLGSWILILEPKPGFYPQTYYNDWKWVHVGLGKIFLAALMVATGLAGVILSRRIPALASLFRMAPSDEVLDRIALRFMMLALIFDSFMLIAGAVWAQDAWGRYWAWDALETSSFLNWLAIGLFIHLRLAYRIPIWVSSLVIAGLFAFAFITYFGTPYLSQAIHKGVV
ncbi:MAG: hypothetical protein A2V90_06630 [Gammaproteobacteria bacterium RBG_16_57_12]|nr:MAG: hypothetical protein A2V90_06630 [Gammaproteobacteria bacterium RBG_16_57_12]